LDEKPISRANVLNCLAGLPAQDSAKSEEFQTNSPRQDERKNQLFLMTEDAILRQVTGVRQDAYAKAHRIKVEEDKPAQERGHYLHPELFAATQKEAVGSNVAPPVTLPVTKAETKVGNLG
jgi:hypothetical protein